MYGRYEQRHRDIYININVMHGSLKIQCIYVGMDVAAGETS